MSYTTSVKEELLQSKFHCEKCALAFVYGYLYFAKKGMQFKAFSREEAELVAQKTVEATSVIVTIVKDGKNKYTLCINNDEDVECFNKIMSGINAQSFLKGELKRECCFSAFVRGVFLACGSISSPDKEYHLELCVQNKLKADLLEDIFLQKKLKLKKTVRKGNTVFYITDSERLEDMLTLMGAYKHSLDLMNVKIEKELRNNVNRAANCENANIDKTVKASMKQISDINFIFEKKGQEYLSDDLLKVALIRLENPEASLNELRELLDEDISRSGLNHRLKKLSSIADMLR